MIFYNIPLQYYGDAFVLGKGDARSECFFVKGL